MKESKNFDGKVSFLRFSQWITEDTVNLLYSLFDGKLDKHH